MADIKVTADFPDEDHGEEQLSLPGMEPPLKDVAEDTCDDCGSPLEVGMYPFCQGDPNKHVQTRYLKFPEFHVEVDGQQIRFSDLGQIRRYEQRSEQAARNGEGQQQVFRAFSNEPSSQDSNTLQSKGYRQPTIKELQNPKLSTKRHGTRRPDVKLGPVK